MSFFYHLADIKFCGFFTLAASFRYQALKTIRAALATVIIRLEGSSLASYCSVISARYRHERPILVVTVNFLTLERIEKVQVHELIGGACLRSHIRCLDDSPFVLISVGLIKEVKFVTAGNHPLTHFCVCIFCVVDTSGIRNFSFDELIVA